MIAAARAGTRSVIRVREWEGSAPVRVPEADLRELLALRPKLDVRPCGDGRWSVVARSYVGRVCLPSADVEIMPKCPIQNVLELIAYAQRVPELRAGIHESAAGSLTDLVIAAFAEQLERLVSAGLRRDYREAADDLVVLRGRLDLERQIRRPHGARLRLSCRYEDHTLATPFNAVLRYALSRAATPWMPLARRLSALRSRLEAVPSRPFTPDEIERFHYDRLTEFYAPAHRMCRLVLEGAGVAFEDHGDVPAGSFLVDMNRVFEGFVARWLAEHLPSPFSVDVQSTHHLDLEGGIPLRPDVLIRRAGEVIAVVDAKYKVRTNASVSSDDAFQALAYARRFGLRQAWLLFADADVRIRAAHTTDGQNAVVTVGLGLTRPWGEVEDTMRRVRDELVRESVETQANSRS